MSNNYGMQSMSTPSPLPLGPFVTSEFLCPGNRDSAFLHTWVHRPPAARMDVRAPQTLVASPYDNKAEGVG